jgi:hypothetical protein
LIEEQTADILPFFGLEIIKILPGRWLEAAFCLIANAFGQPLNLVQSIEDFCGNDVLSTVDHILTQLLAQID